MHDQTPLQPVTGLLGTRAGHYTLIELLGRGGMGDVFRAINPELGAVVAIKILNATGHAEAPRFLAEARAVNRITHDGVVKIMDGGYLDGGRPYLVMELLEGTPLAALLTRPLEQGRALRIVDEVLDAVGAAHAVGIVHRDLKPANVFVTWRGRAVVLDFGVAKLLDGSSSITRTGAMVGTPGYMAPEQIHAATVDARTDIYALGVVLFELLTGERPFGGATPFHVAQAHLSQPVPRLPLALAKFQPLIDRALAKDPRDRYPSAEAMRAALAALSPTATPARRWPWILVGGVVVAGAAVAALVASRGQDAAPRVAAMTPVADAAPPPPDAARVQATYSYVQCSKDAADPTFDGHDREIEVAGACNTVTLSGTGNDVQVDTTGTLIVKGTGNSVTIHDSREIEVTGTRNRVWYGSHGTPQVRIEDPRSASEDAKNKVTSAAWANAPAPPPTAPPKPTRKPARKPARAPQQDLSAPSTMPPECEAYVRWLEHYARCKVFDAATRDRVLESIPQLRTAFSSGGSPSVKAARAQTCAHLLATDRQGAALVGCD